MLIADPGWIKKSALLSLALAVVTKNTGTGWHNINSMEIMRRHLGCTHQQCLNMLSHQMHNSVLREIHTLPRDSLKYPALTGATISNSILSGLRSIPREVGVVIRKLSLSGLRSSLRQVKAAGIQAPALPGAISRDQ